MKGRAVIPLVLGLAIGGFAIKIFVDVLKKAKAGSMDTVEVVRARVDIGPAIEVGAAMLEVATVPASLAPKMFFRDPKELHGRVTTQTVPQGMPLVPSILAPKGTPPGMAARIRDGYRAVSVKVDEFVGVAGWIKPGCRVDVVAVMNGRRQNESETVSRVILQNVEVLAVGQDIGNSGETAAAVAKSVTLLVTPDAVPKLHLAATKGTLRLAMRNQGDAQASRSSTTTDNELLGGDSRTGQTAAKAMGMFAQLFAKQPKSEPAATDKEPAARKAPEPAAPAPDPRWVVEVINGSKTYNMLFDGEGANARCVSARPSSDQAPQKAAPSGQTAPQESPAGETGHTAASLDEEPGNEISAP